MSSDESSHSAEMSRRRDKGKERSGSGPVFHKDAGKDDGFFCWVVISKEFWEGVLEKKDWHSDRTPGSRTKRVKVSRSERKVIFRLRGFEPKDMKGYVENRTVIIGEFWPNSVEENYRGINFVFPDETRWDQDLYPTNKTVFELSIRGETLWLNKLNDVEPPSQ